MRSLFGPQVRPPHPHSLFLCKALTDLLRFCLTGRTTCHSSTSSWTSWTTSDDAVDPSHPTARPL